MRDYLYNLATGKAPEQTFWYCPIISRLLKALLFILSLIYGLAVRVLVFYYRLKPCRLNCQVISAGNITLGGTGKTSLVEFIARYLKEQGRKVAILSRGYKRKVTGYGLSLDKLGISFDLAHDRSMTVSEVERLRRGTLSEVQVQVAGYETMGDEPYMLTVNLKDVPVIVDPNRIRAAKQAICDYGADTVILDDGFQQWKINKDLEIVTIDSLDPFGNLHLLPRGILREPLSSLKRADVFVLTKTNLNPDTQDIKDFLSSINPQALIIESVHAPLGFYRIGGGGELLRPEALRGKTVTLASGIGDPDSFENLIMSLGINVGLCFRFPDHYDYSPKDLENIINESRKKDIGTMIVTEKDAVRLSKPAVSLKPLAVFALRIELKIIKDEQRFHNRLLKLYNL